MNALLLAMLLAQPRNVVVVTLDGLRPEEVFDGAQRSLMHGVEEEQGLVDKYWRAGRDARREALMPFFWKTVAREGQVFGDASLDSHRTDARPRLYLHRHRAAPSGGSES